MVQEGQQHVSAVDDVHSRAQRREGAGILASDHSGADYRKGFGQAIESQYLIRVVYAVVFELELLRSKRARACRDQNFLAAQQKVGRSIGALSICAA